MHSIPYLDVSCSPLVLPIEGKSLMPFCHFELEPSDYLNKRGSDEGLGSTNVEMANIRVIEFEACRVGLTSTRSVSLSVSLSIKYLLFFFSFFCKQEVLCCQSYKIQLRVYMVYRRCVLI